MKTKTLSLFIITALILTLSVSLISATISFTNVPILSKDDTSVDIIIESTENETINFSGLADIEDSQGDKITFTIPSSVTVTAGTPEPIIINYNIDPEFDFKFGNDYSTVLTAVGDSGLSPAVDKTLSFDVSYCESGNPGDLDINIKDITVRGFSDNDNEWYPLDEVEIEVKVENNGDEKIKNIEVEWCLYDEDNKECVIDDTESDFDLKDDKDETVTIEFTIDPDDLDGDVEDYTFYVKATGEVYAGTYEGEDTCASDSESIEMIIADDFVILGDIEITPETVQCGSEIQITADVWNIGSDDQRDVYVLIENRDLKISEKVDIGDIDAFDDDNLNIDIQLPEDAKEGSYKLNFKVFDRSDDIYESPDNEKAEFSKVFQIEGSCIVEPNVLVSASLAPESESKAGKELIVKATITNTGDSLETFSISASNYEDWASLNNIDPEIIILGADQSKDVLITLDVNKDIKGEKSFSIEVSADDKKIATQPVSIEIEEYRGISLPITGGAIGAENWYLWAIGALNVILVIIIIIVAIRVARS